MDRFNKLSRGMQIMLVGSVLLLISTFFNWQEITFEFLGESASGGVSAWHGFLGVVMGLLTVVLIAWLVARLAAVDLPVPVSLTGAVLAFLIFACALIKNLTDDYSTFWSYLGIGLAALIAVGAWMQIQEAGGVDNLKSEATNVTSTAGAATAAAAGAATAAAGDAAGATKDAASDAAGTAKDAAGGAPGAVASGAEGAADKASDTASDAADAVKDKIDEST